MEIVFLYIEWDDAYQKTLPVESTLFSLMCFQFDINTTSGRNNIWKKIPLIISFVFWIYILGEILWDYFYESVLNTFYYYFHVTSFPTT